MKMKWNMFLGHETSWWIAVRAVLRKAGLEGPDTPEKLGALLGVEAPPCWTEERSGKRVKELESEST
jgi:hypothetical protein